MKFERRTHVSAGIPSFAASTVASTNQSYQGGGHSHGFSEGSHGGGGHSSHISSSSKYGQHYTSLYATPATSNVSTSSSSSSNSRRLTVSGASAGHGHVVHGGDPTAYYSGGSGGGASSFSSSARKNTASMYVTGSSNTIGVATGADYLRQVNNASNNATVTANASFGHGSSSRG